MGIIIVSLLVASHTSRLTFEAVRSLRTLVGTHFPSTRLAFAFLITRYRTSVFFFFFFLLYLHSRSKSIAILDRSLRPKHVGSIWVAMEHSQLMYGFYRILGLLHQSLVIDAVFFDGPSGMAQKKEMANLSYPIVRKGPAKI